MKKGGRLLACLCVTLLFFSGCDYLPWGKQTTTPQPVQHTQTQAPRPPVTGTVIATINGYPITLEELNDEVEAFNNRVPEDRPELRINTREKKIEYLKNEMIRRVLLYLEAMNRKLDRNPDVMTAIEKTKMQLLVFQLIKEETDRVTVSSQDIEDYYERFKENLKEPEERKVREMMVISQSQAKDLLIRLLQGEDFATLARAYSKAPSAAQGGDLGFVKPGEKFKEFDEVVFSDVLEVGQTSNVFKGPDGYYIVELEAKRGGKQRSLSEMWEDIKRGLTFVQQQKRIEDLVGELSTKANMEIKEDLVP